MPYKTNEELPDSVKTALPSEGQAIFRGAFNPAIAEAPEDEESANKAAWGAVKKAGYTKEESGKWVKMAQSKPFEIEVFSTGNYHGDDYTAQDLDDMVTAFSELKDTIKPPLKLGHNEAQMKDIMRDGQPALGWVSGLRRAGERLMAQVSNMPEIVKTALDKKLYKRVSSEIMWGFKDSMNNIHRRVLHAVALLGADIPEVKNLEDLTAYLSQSTGNGSGSFDAIKSYSFKVDDNKKIKQEKPKMPDEDVKVYKDKAESERVAREKAEADLKKFKDDKATEDKKRMTEKKDAIVKELKTYCDDQIKAGKMSPAAVDILFKEDVRKFSEQEGDFIITLDNFKKFMETNDKLDLDEHGERKKKDFSNAENANDKLDMATKKFMDDHKIKSYAEAQAKVVAANPQLAQDAIDEDLEGGK